ncbi:MAG: formylglycine-generating enzyme family protein [Deltaproteobacteria bacterium]|nr:formylglycine-generating enzyme family protein [Deltaproteobacteria bacterium]
MSGQPRSAEKPLKKKLVNKIGMEFILIPGGEFIMGTDALVDDPTDLKSVEEAVREQEKQERYTRYDSAPQHLVKIQSFYMGRTPVTQGQWERVMGHNQASYKGGFDFPMETVNWYEVQEFIKRLNEMMETDAHRLPTEAEWEYACRAGSQGDYCFEGRSSRLENYAWFGANAGFRPRPVAQKKANKFNLFDIHGQVWEWTSSLEKSYPYRTDDGREEPSAAEARVIRGGSWNSDPYFLRCGFREWHLPIHRDHDIGFRLAVS